MSYCASRLSKLVQTCHEKLINLAVLNPMGSSIAKMFLSFVPWFSLLTL